MADPPAPQQAIVASPASEFHPADHDLPTYHVYAIACLDGHYRNLGAVCCPYPYESTTKESIVLLLRRIFSDPSNIIPLSLELQLGADFYARRGYPPPPQNPPSEHEEQPCFPSIHTCLCVGFASLMDDSHFAGWKHFGERVFPLSADEILGNCPSGYHSKPTIIPNPKKDGDEARPGMPVIFIDVTDPVDIKHRFTIWECDLDPALRSPQKLEHLMTGWSLPVWSLQGIRVGYWNNKEMREIAVASRLELGALKETWPGVSWSPDPSQQPVRLRPDLTYVRRHQEWTMNRTNMVASWAKVTWTELFRYEARLPIGERTPFRLFVRAEMKEQRGKVVPWKDTIQLLRWAYRDEIFLDWACFAGLTADVLRSVLEDDPRSGGIPLANARILSICPDWQEEEPQALAEAICSPKGVRFCDVYIMTLPEQAASAEICRKTGQLYEHLVEHERCPTGKILLTGAYSSGLHERFWLPQPSSLSVAPRSRVLQFLLHNREISHDGTIGIGSYTFQSYFLGDACLTPTKVVNGVLDFIEQTVMTPDDR